MKKTIKKQFDELELIGSICHELNRVISEYDGSQDQVNWSEAPKWQKKATFNTIIKIISGEISNPKDAHDVWMKHKISNGWVYGDKKDARKKHTLLCYHIINFPNLNN